MGEATDILEKAKGMPGKVTDMPGKATGMLAKTTDMLVKATGMPERVQVCHEGKQTGSYKSCPPL